MTYLMNLDRLKSLLEAYGANPSRWPAEERDAAEAMIAASDQAREALAEASRLDALLDQAPPPPPVDRLGWRLRGIGPRAELMVASTGRRSAFSMTNLARAAAVVLAIAGGVAVGTAIPGQRGTQTQTVADNGATTRVANASDVPFATAYEDAELADGDGSITLAGYSEDSLSLPLQ